MSATKFKFCGMKRVEDAREAERLKANYIGVILTASPRKVSIDEALRLFDAAPSPRKVGVVGIGTASSFARAARDLELDVIQVHRALTPDETARLRDEFDGNIWAVIPVEEKTGSIPPEWHQIADSADALLLDTSAGGRTGGTGKSFNWKNAEVEARKVEREIPIVLAGGLNPANVAEAIGILRPSVVDVSSGVESAPGVKDHNLMQAFAKAVLSASIV